MITLILDGKTAALPEDIDLTLEFENPFFTKNGSYSYNIDLDLNNRLNLAIFGHINRLSVQKLAPQMTCRLYKDSHLFFVGNATVTSISDTTVSIQLLGDSSSIHFFSQDIYIDELDLGYAVCSIPSDFHIFESWQSLGETHYSLLFGSVDKIDAVFFPASGGDPASWSENSIYPNNIHHHYGGIIVDYPYKSSVQPYLIRVFERVATAMGYTITRNDWNDTWLRNLYIVNHKRGAWRQYGSSSTRIGDLMAKALPHWSVSKFIDELEKLLAVIIMVDDHRKQIEVISLDTYYDDVPVVNIATDMTLDAYEVELDGADTNKSLTSGNIGFNHTYRDKFLQVSQKQMQAGETVEYDSYDAIVSDFSSLGDGTKSRQIFLNKATNRTYVAVSNNGSLVLKECNIFGNLSRDGSDDTDVELDIIPADTKVHAITMYFDTVTPTQQTVSVDLPYTDTESDTADTVDTMENIITNGAPAEKSESEVMEVMISTGESYQLTTYSGNPCSYPQAFADYGRPIAGQSHLPYMSLSLHDVCEQSLGHRYSQIPVFDTSKPFKMTFFHPDKIDTRSILLIRNQKYVIRQLTVKMSHESSLNCYEAELYRLE